MIRRCSHAGYGIPYVRSWFGCRPMLRNFPSPCLRRAPILSFDSILVILRGYVSLNPLPISRLKSRPSKLLACVSYDVRCHCSRARTVSSVLATMTLHECETMGNSGRPRKPMRNLQETRRKPSDTFRKLTGNPSKPEAKTGKPIDFQEPIHPEG